MRGRRLVAPGLPIPGTKGYDRFIQGEVRRAQFESIQGSLDKLVDDGLIVRIRPKSNLERMVTGDDD